MVEIKFADRCVTYDRFMEDLTARLAEAMRQVRDDPEYVSQNMAYRMFGRSNVERWRRHGKIEPVKRPNKLEYRTSELRLLQSTKQDYLLN